MSVNVRLWRPAAQRGVRNGFSMIEGARLKWEEASSRGLAAATGIVNAHLSGRYLGQWDLGVLSDLEGIRECAAKKLQWQQGTYAEKLQDALEDLVASLASMDEAAASIRMYVNEIDTPSKGSPSPLGENRNENVIPVYGALPLSAFENWARETVDMFHRELKVKIHQARVMSQR
ncbi:hypothetical protein CBR_g39231 [Chara braunii]|uniref:Uncharacterized protein n=1 Tax=Chara braunii TaxID=69332 RepID=A0A388LRH1_CHABU|nr:hypothetical protein CBR_g39231 [Chara braunii]|eukprot:GBG84855.1 hypothetical protein CBR_g39231 [Chara braunii]